MKMIRRFFLALTVFFTLSAMTLTARAAYKYRVTMSAGLHGKIVAGSTDAEFDYKQMWNPNDYQVEVTDPRYYFKGWHVSGIEGIAQAKTITEDTVFVATYGIKGNTVQYTVRYLDENNKPLKEDKVYYGNIGDKPVASYVYINDYQPQAYNITTTLSSNAADNVLVFKYKKTDSTQQNQNSNKNKQNSGGNNSSGKNSTSSKSSDSAASENKGSKLTPDTGAQQGEPEQIIDLDENNETADIKPADNGNTDAKHGSQGNSLIDTIRKNAGIFGGGLAALLVALFFLFKKLQGEK